MSGMTSVSGKRLPPGDYGAEMREVSVREDGTITATILIFDPPEFRGQRIRYCLPFMGVR